MQVGLPKKEGGADALCCGRETWDYASPPESPRVGEKQEQEQAETTRGSFCCIANVCICYRTRLAEGGKRSLL